MKQYDICIVGSGAGASPVAYELSRAGYRVLVLEKGPYLTEKDFTKDEIAVSRRSIYTPRLREEQHVVETYDSDGSIDRVTAAESGWNFWNGSMVGGSSNLMSGYFHRMKPVDFRLRSAFGPVAGANVVDWPISYDDMEPYFTKVEQLVGVSGRVVEHPFQERRSTKDFPFPPTWEQPISGWFDTACETLGYHSIPTPRAVLPFDALGRSGCSYSNFCGSYGCATGAKGNARAALLEKAKATGRCDILPNVFVYRLDADRQHVTAAHYFDADGRPRTVTAGTFVVAAQAIESVRLLFNSRNDFHPDGLGNANGQLGKNLIFSAGGSGQGRFEFARLNERQRFELMTRGAFVNRSLQEWYVYHQNGRAVKGGTIDFLFEHANPVSRALRELYDDDGNLLWGRKLQARLEHAFTASRIFAFEVFNDWMPTDKCFVSVDESVKDKWGVPVGKIRLYGHPQDIEVGNYLAEKAESVLRQMGAVEIESDISSAPPPNLVAGGCRFGTDPEHSVLDPNCKMHGIDNLYVSDASFMPTGGSVPYTWTIYANAFRVADAIMAALKGRETGYNNVKDS
ncbi:GMC family oxidoreductase [Sulfurimonas sp. HSL-3221]|uniref:GMC family oxidoreductase n=1 Tax=Sulfurimonadaceae TaxID=2771471 RepID=UPI001E64CB99|nr:GMC family oxidoreductase [Sulfurimonas sp. HSL-3221]UFS61327.1 GMC family oxidoreductase [Sulfurimonas sp. HSL-3221]